MVAPASSNPWGVFKPSALVNNVFFDVNGNGSSPKSRWFKDVVVGSIPSFDPIISFIHSFVKDTIHNFFVNLKFFGMFSIGLLDFCDVVIPLACDLDYSLIFAIHSYQIFNCQMRFF
ncbi:hypothetical protein IEQ34_021479 [Dendrobium chrysotoxum]|uniref:Uncharacterized protein n=1 Tax=Dendrobium chrysotoxum TaxID=161865 RepID=A0AAV7G4W8_DENCH|nr:hypothetical protein IEQ34_021479 [Dendrobium chrysotoxum]